MSIKVENKTGIFNKLRSVTSSKKLAATGVLAASVGLIASGLGDTLTNKVCDYRKDTTNLENFLGKYVPLVGIPGMLGSLGVLAFLNGMPMRLIYFALAGASFLKSAKHDGPLMKIAREINLIDKIQTINAKKVKGQPLNAKDREFLNQAVQKGIITQQDAQLILGNNLSEDTKEYIYELYANLDQRRYSLIKQGAEHNGKRGWFGQVYSAILGITWFTVLHRMLSGKAKFKAGGKEAGKFKVEKAEHLDGESIFGGVKGKNGKFFESKKPMGQILKENIIEEFKAPFVAIKEVFSSLSPKNIKNSFSLNPKKNEDLKVALESSLKNIRQKKGKENTQIGDLSTSTKLITMMAAGAPGLIMNLGCLVSRGAGYGLSLPWVNKYGTNIFNENSPYYTQEQHDLDELNKKNDPSTAKTFDAGQSVLAASRYISSFAAAMQAFNPGQTAIYGGPFFTTGMLATAASYGLSASVGKVSPVMGQALTIIGTAANMVAVYGGLTYSQFKKGAVKAKPH